MMPPEQRVPKEGKTCACGCGAPVKLNPALLEPVTSKTNVLIGNGITAKPDGRICRACKRMHRRRETEAEQRRATATFEEDGQ